MGLGWKGFMPGLVLLLSHHPRLVAPQAVTSQITIQLYGTTLPPIAQADILHYSQGTTTLKLLCNPNSTAAGCGQQLMNNYTLAPGIQRMQASLDGQYTVVENCTIAAATATCNDFESAYNEVSPAFSPTTTMYNYTTSYTTTYGQADITTLTLDVVGGADMLPNGSSSVLVSATSLPSSTGVASTSSATQQAPASSTSSNPKQTATTVAKNVASKAPSNFRAIAAAVGVAVLRATT